MFRLGEVGCGAFSLGMTRYGRQGEVSCDMAWLGPIWHGKARQAEFCRVRSGLATFGPLWLGRRG